MPVMGMVECLWGLSDGVNAAGLSVALAFGGRSEVARGFGVTTILRYVLETCATVGQALAVLARVPSHMAYNVTLADRHEATATVELVPGGGARRMPSAIATNHQHGPEAAECSALERSEERLDHLEMLLSNKIAPDALGDVFLKEPLFQRNYSAGSGTLFTALYDPKACSLELRWPGHSWSQRLDAFREGRREIRYLDDLRPIAAHESEAPADVTEALEALRPFLRPARMQAFNRWVRGARTYSPDWSSFGEVFSE
jgi:predicted choloylglycine hydrolase